MRLKQHETSNLPCTQPPLTVANLNHLVESKNLAEVSLSGFMDLWLDYVRRLALQKLQDVINIYEDQISIKSFSSLDKKRKLKPVQNVTFTE